jgi:ferredoxin
MNPEQGNKTPFGAVLVVGAGIGGIQAALDLAESGYYVYLLESSPSIGGFMARLDKTFPTNDCAMCILSPKLVEYGRHLNINLITYAELKEVSGEAGRFRVKILKKPRYVDLEKCTGCGLCAQMELPEGKLEEVEGEIWVDRIKIDEQACIQCGDCVKACIEENKDVQGMSSIAFERRQLIENLPQERAPQEIQMHEVARIDTQAREDFWRNALNKCIKCYGCRDVCPLCVCDECELDDPEWVALGQIPPQYPLFHLIRAYHLADLCIGCGACEATCPMGIPLMTMMHLARIDGLKIFDYVPGLDAEQKNRLINHLKEHPITERGIKVWA